MGCHRHVGVGLVADAPAPPSACPASTRAARSRSGTAGSERPRCGQVSRTRASRWSSPTTPAVGARPSAAASTARPLAGSRRRFPHWFCRDVIDLRRARVGDAGRPAPVAGAGRAARAARRQCDRRPLGGSARRVPGDAGGRRGLAIARRPRPRRHGDAARGHSRWARTCVTTCAPVATTSRGTTGSSTWRP